MELFWHQMEVYYIKKIYSENVKTTTLEEMSDLKEGIKNKVTYLDCLINEVQGSVNSAFVDGVITEEQCDYLYKKYIRMEK